MKLLRADCKYVTSRDSTVRWLEFPGTHYWAPPKYYSEVFRWLNQQATLHK